jgi:hypothetical protein
MKADRLKGAVELKLYRGKGHEIRYQYRYLPPIQGVFLDTFPGVKTRAQSRGPFGTKTRTVRKITPHKPDLSTPLTTDARHLRSARIAT